MASSHAPINPPPDAALARLHAQLEMLEKTLSDMMMMQQARQGIAGPELQKHFQFLFGQCQLACPDDQIIWSMDPGGGYGTTGMQHLVTDMLGKVRFLRAALPIPSLIAPAWVADLRATGRTLLRLLKLLLWPFITLNRRIRIDERQPVWRVLTIAIETLLGAALLYLLARLGLQR